MIKHEPLEAGNKHNKPKMIVVHYMGEFITDPYPIHAQDFLAKLGLSAHALICPNGDVIVCRCDDEGAYHARGYNTDSLGVEFLVQGNHDYTSFIETIKTDYVTAAQWDAGVEVVKNWATAWNIPKEKVVRHCDISPGRKVDPGTGFKWTEFQNKIFEGK